MTKYVGLDVSMEATSVCVMNEEGAVIWRGRVKTEPEALAAAIRRRAPELVRVGMESGGQSTWLWHSLRAMGIAVICIDARHAQASLSMKINKSDEHDAEGIATLMKVGWYREVQVKSLSSHADGAALAGRALLVEQRCALENQIRGLLKNFGLRVKATKGRAFGQAVSELAEKEATIGSVVGHLLEAWRALRQEIALLTRRIEQQARADEVCRLLMTAPGVGPITALAYRATIDDPQRFRHSASVGAYLGLTPRRYASGAIDRNGHISLMGDGLLRRYLYEAGNVVLTRSSESNALKSWGLKVAKRIGMKKARIAVARELAVVLHRMWQDGTEFGAPKACL
jgi:transposase